MFGSDHKRRFSGNWNSVLFSQFCIRFDVTMRLENTIDRFNSKGSGQHSFSAGVRVLVFLRQRARCVKRAAACVCEIVSPWRRPSLPLLSNHGL